MKLYDLCCGILVLSLIMTAGCATQRSAPLSILQAQQGQLRDVISLDELIEEVDKNNTELESFKADMKLTFMDNIRAKGKPVHCHGKIALEKPDKLRMYGTQPLVGKVFDLVSNPERFYIYSPKDGRVLTGSSTRPENVVEPATKIRPNDVMHAFLLYDIIAMTQKYACFFEHSDSSYILYLVEHTGEHYSLAKKIWVSDTLFEITRHQTFFENGELELDVKITDFYDFDDYGFFPKRMEIESPFRQLKLVMEFSKIDLNPAFNDNVFTFDINDNIEVIELDQ